MSHNLGRNNASINKGRAVVAAGEILRSRVKGTY